MNVLYEKIKGKLDSDETQQLAKAQEFWLQYREANCTAERSLYGIGTGATPAYIACLESMTRARTKELRITYAVRLK